MQYSMSASSFAGAARASKETIDLKFSGRLDGRGGTRITRSPFSAMVPCLTGINNMR